MVTNARPMYIELIGRLVSDWEETKKGDFYHTSIAINKFGVTYFIKLITNDDVVDFVKGQKVIIKGNIMEVSCYKEIPRITVFVEVIERA